jgi:arylsulfatase A-like enzyme
VGTIFRSSWFYYGLAALLLVVGIVSQTELRIPSRPVESIDALATLRDRDDVNIIFLLIDTLRADHLGVNGYERDTSPTIDALAQFGIRFADVRGQSSWTKTSMASLWTAMNPAATGVLRFNHGIAKNMPLPAEALREAGFRTAGIFRNGWVEPNFGFGRGFDDYFRPVPNKTQDRYERARSHGHSLPGTDLDITEAAIEFLQNHTRERFFLYLHYMDVHQYLYEESFAEFGVTYKDAYDNAIKWTDYNVAMLVSALDELDLFEKTIIVIASDHGEAFMEHGREGHAQDIHIEVSDVPLILSLPFRLDEPVVVEPLVRNTDIFPTLFDMLGLPAMEGVDGQSLVPLIEASARGTSLDGLAPPVAFAQLDRTWGQANAEPKPFVAIDHEGFRMIYPVPRPDDAMLYDLRTDPTEQNDIIAEHPERREALTARIREYLETAPADVEDVKIDEMLLRQLKALGYAIEPEGAGAPAKKGKGAQ